MFGKTWIPLASLALALTGCASSTDSGDVLTKDDARLMGGKSDVGEDFCATYGWYGDGICDEFCPAPDRDCGGTMCGGIGGLQCPDGRACVDDLSDECDQEHGGADCSGLCQDTSSPGGSCGGFAGLQCDEGEFCDYELDEMCGAADQLGTCKPQPDAASCLVAIVMTAVCGCDGNTYDTTCAAHEAGVAVASNLPCGANPGGGQCGGIAGFQCDDDEFCDYELDEMCGAADRLGTCKPLPTFAQCNLTLEATVPVCGCDGETYNKACEANLAGVAVASEGACS